MAQCGEKGSLTTAKTVGRKKSVHFRAQKRKWSEDSGCSSAHGDYSEGAEGGCAFGYSTSGSVVEPRMDVAEVLRVLKETFPERSYRASLDGTCVQRRIGSHWIRVPPRRLVDANE